MKKIFLSILVSLLFFIPSVSNADALMGKTSVLMGLSKDLNNSGEWEEQHWADGSVQTTAGGGNVSKVGTPVNNQAGVWTGDGTIEGDADFTHTGGSLTLGGLAEVLASADTIGILTLGGVGGANNENITFDFESGGSNVVLISSTSSASIISFDDDIALSLGGGFDYRSYWETAGGKEHAALTTGVGTTQRTGYVMFMASGDNGLANRTPSAPSNDPVYRIYSSDDTNANDYIEFFHDQSNPKVQWGNGSLTLDSNSANTTAITTLENTAGDIQVFRADATPEGSVTGSVGDIVIDGTNGMGYIKSSGSATNTGWEIFAGNPTYKSYSFANPGSAGTYYIGGHYDADAADVTLTIGGTVIQTFGIANEASAVHAFCIASGAGGTDLVLTVTGISITDAGVRNGSDSEIVVADTDTATTNQYFETSKKWLGQVAFTLTGSSGAFTFNYGHVKYDDFSNRDFIITDFEVTGSARANETGLDIELLHHEATAFVYHATAFSPNQTAVVSLATDYSTDNDISTGESFSYKRSGLSTTVNGADSEGYMIRITTAVNNSINDASIHIGATMY